MRTRPNHRIRSVILAGLAGLAFVFGAACNDEGGDLEEGGGNGGGGVFEEGGEGDGGGLENGG